MTNRKWQLAVFSVFCLCCFCVCSVFLRVCVCVCVWGGEMRTHFNSVYLFICVFRFYSLYIFKLFISSILIFMVIHYYIAYVYFKKKGTLFIFIYLFIIFYSISSIYSDYVVHSFVDCLLNKCLKCLGH